MVVNSTEMQNNFGKYLILSLKEDIVITKNGIEIAKLTSFESKSASDVTVEDSVCEKASSYGFYGCRKATYEEFLELTRDTDDRYEYIDGEIYYLASPKATHQIALIELFGSFYNWFQGKKCTPMVAPFDITLKRTQSDINIVQPDIMVICDLNEKLNERDYYTGVPALVIEIISHGTRSKDLVKKLDLYMSCGVKEYWVVNPLNKEVAVFLLEKGEVENNATYNQSGIAKSFIFPGLEVEVKKIFKD